MKFKLSPSSCFSIAGEVSIILFFLFLNNNFFSKEKITIVSDGRGYYEYLPALFIYNDIHFNYLDTLHAEGYDFSIMKNNFYARQPNGKRFDKYFIGTTLLQAPFFTVGHLYASSSEKHKADGFSTPYQLAIYASALCYLFIGLIFLRLLLLNIGVSRWAIFVLQVGVFYCTSLMLYSYINASFSHVYSFFAVSAWLYFTYFFFKKNKGHLIYFSIFFLGLIVMIRPINVLVILFVPFLLKITQTRFNSLYNNILSHKRIFLFGLISVVLLTQLQCAIWYAQTGHWIYYAYQDESFNWSDAHFIDFLFSYRKGFFLWAPWFFVLLISSSIRLFFQKYWGALVYFWIPFIILAYVLSSWHDWGYGASFGVRPMIDFYPILICFAAFSFTKLKWMPLLLHSVVVICFAYVAIVQTYQYQHYILHWSEMSRQSYWKVFLKTDKAYEGLLWR